MSTPEQRKANQAITLAEFRVAVESAWKLLDAAAEYLPQDLRVKALEWCRLNLLWGTPETIAECREWLEKRGFSHE